MPEDPKPSWTDNQKRAGERTSKAWDQFFSASESKQHGSKPDLPDHLAEGRFADIRARHEARLLSYPNVVGVAEGIRTKNGEPTGEPCLVVYVNKKTPPDKLAKNELLPMQIDGAAVDVVEIGQVETLPL